MANTLTPIDSYSLINSIAQQAQARTSLTATDTSSFVAVGETILRTGYENTLNAISTVLSRTIFASRPYSSKLRIMQVEEERWGAQVRKITYLPKAAEASKDMNNNLDATVLDDGASVDPWVINKPVPVQFNFYGTKLLQRSITKFKHQLDLAFTNEQEFARFIEGYMTELMNDIEQDYEARKRACLINFIAGKQAMSSNVVDLVYAYNNRDANNPTTYTREQLLTTYREDFLKFVAATIKIDSDLMTNRTKEYHVTPATCPTYILRHTEKSKQRMIMYGPFFTAMETEVMPTIFNPEYLNIGEFEKVDYWQAFSTPTAINVVPNIMNVNTGASETASAAVTLDYVLGVLYDVDAIGTFKQFDWAASTTMNPRGGYMNEFFHWKFNEYNDYTENAIVYILGAGGQ